MSGMRQPEWDEGFCLWFREVRKFMDASDTSRKYRSRDGTMSRKERDDLEEKMCVEVKFD